MTGMLYDEFEALIFERFRLDFITSTCPYIIQGYTKAEVSQQGIYTNQQQYRSHQGPDAAGFVETKKYPVEELSLAVGTVEIRSYVLMNYR